MINSIFNNREIAALIWIIISVIVLCIKRSTRKITFRIISNKLLWQLIIYSSIYTSILIFMLYKLKFWNIFMLKDTIVWIFTAITLLFIKLSKNDYNFSNIIKETIKTTIILEFIVNMYSFNLIIEFVLLFVLTIIFCMKEVCNGKKEYVRVLKLLESILSIIGIIILIYTIKSILINSSNLDIIIIIKDMVLQPMLTIMFIPCIYLWGLYSEMENIYIHIKDKKHIQNPKKIVFNMVIICKFNLNKIRKFWQLNSFEILSCGNIQEIKYMLKIGEKNKND